jgi:hypothetical protein
LNVLDEASDELVGRKAGSGVAFRPEEDAFVGEVEEALVGDADTVSVASQVAEDLLRVGERLLGVGDPGGLVELIPEPGEAIGVA